MLDTDNTWLAMSLQEWSQLTHLQNGLTKMVGKVYGLGETVEISVVIPGETWLHRARGRIAVVRRLQGRCLRADFAGAPTWYGQELAVGSCGYPAGTFSCHVSSLQLVVLDSDQYSHLQSLPRP